MSTELPSSDDGLKPLTRYEDDWVEYEDVKLAMVFVTSYLGEHKGLLEDLGAHKKILNSVQYIIDEINKL